MAMPALVRDIQVPAGHHQDHGGAAPGEETAAVYRYAVRRDALDSLETAAVDLGLSLHQVIAAVTRLVELHLLRTDGAEGTRLVPVDPRDATATAVTPIERGIYQRRELADRMRARIDAIARPAGGSIDAFDGVDEIRGLLKLTRDVCHQEVVVLRPATGDEELLDDLLAPCFEVLDRGVAVRVLGSHRVRADFGSRAKARRLVDDGAQLRTLSQVPEAAVVFDRGLAVIFALPEHGGDVAARRVQDANVVRFLVDVFDQLWDGATPYVLEQPGYAGAVDDLQRSVARLMAEGLTDEAVARRLGMSVRSCRRHIASLLQNLDAVSRFQAGVQAAALL